MPSGHAYAKAVRTVKTCVGTEVLPLRPRRRDRRRHRARARDGGPAHAAQGQVGGRGLPAQLRRGLRQGHRPRRRRGRLGDLRRRRRGRERAQGRPAGDGRDDARRRMRVALAFLQHYREHGEHLERTYGYLERVGHRGGARGRCSTRSGRPRCSSASRSPRRRATPTRGASARRPCTRKQFAELDSDAELDLVAVRGGRAMSVAVRGRWTRRPRRGRARCSRAAASTVERPPRSPSSACPTAGRRSTPPARTSAGRCRTASSPTAASPARCTAAASTCETGARQGGGDRVAVHEVEERDGELWVAAGRVTRSRRVAAHPRGAHRLPVLRDGLRADRRGRRGGRVDRGQGRPAAPGQPRRDLPQAAAAARGADAPPTARPTPLWRDALDARWRERTLAPGDRRAGAAAAATSRERHGPDAIAFYISGQLLTEDYYAVTKLAKGFLGTNNVDSNSRLCMSSAVAGYTGALGSDGPPPSYADLDQADHLLLLGSNTRPATRSSGRASAAARPRARR